MKIFNTFHETQKNPQQIRSINLTRGIYEKRTTNIIFNGETLNAFSLKIRNRIGWFTLTTSFNAVLNILVRALSPERKKKERKEGRKEGREGGRKDILLREEEVKLWGFFSDDIIMYIENPTKSTKN